MKRLFLTSVLLIATLALWAQNAPVTKKYKLPAPKELRPTQAENKVKKGSLRDALKMPEDVPVLDVEITLEILSSILNNIYKPENTPEVVKKLIKDEDGSFDVYVVTEKGVYAHNREKNTLNLKVVGDGREQLVGDKKEWADAKCFLVAVPGNDLNSSLQDVRSALRAMNSEVALTDFSIDDERSTNNANEEKTKDSDAEQQDGQKATEDKSTTQSEVTAEKEQKEESEEGDQPKKIQLPLPEEYAVFLVVSQYDFD